MMRKKGNNARNNFLYSLQKMLCVFSFFIFSFLSAEIIVTEEVTFYVSENTTVIGLELPKETPITKIQEVHSVTLSEGAYIVRLENLHYSVAQPKTLSIDQTAKSPVTKDVKTVKKSPEPTKVDPAPIKKLETVITKAKKEIASGKVLTQTKKELKSTK